MSDDGGIGPGNDAQNTHADQGGNSFWALEILLAPFEILGLFFRAIRGLLAAIFASA